MQFDLQDTQSWVKVHEQNYLVNWVDIKKKKYNPIPDINISISFSSIIVGINCPKAYIEWRLAAWATIQAKIPLGSDFGHWIDIKNEQLMIQRLTLLEASFISATEFNLKLKTPHWHEEIYVEVWEQQ